MEAAELVALMFCICLFGTLLYSGASPLEPLGLSRINKAFLMGVAVAITTSLIIRSPFGPTHRRTLQPRHHAHLFLSWLRAPLGHALLLRVSVRRRSCRRVRCPPDSRRALIGSACLLRHYNSGRIWQLRRVLLRSSPCRDCLWPWCSLLLIAGL